MATIEYLRKVTTSSILLSLIPEPGSAYCNLAIVDDNSGRSVSTTTGLASGTYNATGLSAGTKYRFTIESFDSSDTSLGTSDSHTFSTKITDLDGDMFEISWRGARTDWQQRELDIDKNRITVSTDIASQWHKLNLKCDMVGVRMTIKAMKLHYMIRGTAEQAEQENSI